MTDTLETAGAVTIEQVSVPMRDGLSLAGTLHRAPGGPHPVILVRTPYSEPLSRALFKAGHRIRVDVASSNFPSFDRNPGTGTPAGQVTEDEFVRATQQVFFGESFIRLPVIPSDREVDNKW